MVAACVAVAVLVAGYFVTGMPGMNHGSNSSMSGMEMDNAAAAYQIVGPDGFAALLSNPSATVINVHVPYDGEIDGTDLFLPFDSLDRTKLPTAKSALLLVYCRTGNMSSVASAKLVSLGYTNVVELAGGMQAWSDSKRTITQSATKSG